MKTSETFVYLTIIAPNKATKYCNIDKYNYIAGKYIYEQVLLF